MPTVPHCRFGILKVTKECCILDAGIVSITTADSWSVQVDTAKVLSQVSQKVMGIKPTPGTNMAAAFGHMAGGYDAQYYGYLVSRLPRQ